VKGRGHNKYDRPDEAEVLAMYFVAVKNEADLIN
jgi:hypothetical protein